LGSKGLSCLLVDKIGNFYLEHFIMCILSRLDISADKEVQETGLRGQTLQSKINTLWCLMTVNYYHWFSG